MGTRLQKPRRYMPVAACIGIQRLLMAILDKMAIFSAGQVARIQALIKVHIS